MAVRAQSIVDAARRIDWSEAGVPGGIPERTATCATLSPGVTAHQIPAQACFETTPRSSDGTLAFSPAQCYPIAAAPQVPRSPTNVRVIR
jgi:hypothetical protein